MARYFIASTPIGRIFYLVSTSRSQIIADVNVVLRYMHVMLAFSASGAAKLGDVSFLENEVSNPSSSSFLVHTTRC